VGFGGAASRLVANGSMRCFDLFPVFVQRMDVIHLLLVRGAISRIIVNWSTASAFNLVIESRKESPLACSLDHAGILRSWFAPWLFQKRVDGLESVEKS
jgi:hypothetical protein